MRACSADSWAMPIAKFKLESVLRVCHTYTPGVLTGTSFLSAIFNHVHAKFLADSPLPSSSLWPFDRRREMLVARQATWKRGRVCCVLPPFITEQGGMDATCSNLGHRTGYTSVRACKKRRFWRVISATQFALLPRSLLDMKIWRSIRGDVFGWSVQPILLSIRLFSALRLPCGWSWTVQQELWRPFQRSLRFLHNNAPWQSIYTSNSLFIFDSKYTQWTTMAS